MYWTYLKYLLTHKWYVFLECFKEGLFFHAFTHDLSKFLPSEFAPYAHFFARTKKYKHNLNVDEVAEDFQMAWLKHQRRNKHHWNYWVVINGHKNLIPVPIPKKYIRQMLCDWRAMSRKFGDTPLIYFTKNKEKMLLHQSTIDFLIKELNK